MGGGEENKRQPFIRVCDPEKDLDDLVHVFRVTAGPPVQSPGCLDIGEYIWCRPYIALYPQNCFVVDSGIPEVEERDGKAERQRKAVGYIICTPSTPEFVTRWPKEFLPTLPPELKDPPPADAAPDKTWDTNRPLALKYIVHHPEDQLHREQPLLMQDYPAHLHIDVLPEFQRGGYGSTLMRTLLNDLRSKGVRGIHLIMDVDNVGAGIFYQKMGFQRFPVVLDGGASGELGQSASSIWFCMKLTD